MTTIATPANMRAVEAANPSRTLDDGSTFEGRRAIAYSPNTGEKYSATSGDYWNLSDDEPLRDSEGEPMVLVFTRSYRVDALTDELA